MATIEPDHPKNPNIEREASGQPETETPTLPMRGRLGAPGFEPALDPDRGADPSSTTEPNPDALAADRASARTSDRDDGRDGVDASDTTPRDPDGVGGKQPSTQPPRRAAGKSANPRRS